VKWSGTGKFNPPQGELSRPVFNSEGSNKIKLEVTFEGKKIERTYTVNAVSPYQTDGKTLRYAAINDYSLNPADAHGGPCCPHSVIGPIITASPNVIVGGWPIARKGDRGIAAACCGPNTFVIAEGDPNVLIDGRPAARPGDKTTHCGGFGKIVSSKQAVEPFVQDDDEDANPSAGVGSGSAP